MSQHDQNIANDNGANVRSDINNALAALFGLSSGATAPSTTIPYMFWADTTAGLLKQRNAANSAWVTIGILDTTNLGFALASAAANNGANSDITSLSALASINDGPIGGFLNKLINGGFQIYQYDATPCINGSYYGGCDRWLNVTSATTVTAGSVIQNTNINAASGFCHQFSGLSTTGSTTVGVKQRCERTTVYDMNSKSIVVSGKVYQNTGSPQTLYVGVFKANALNDFTGITQVGSYSTISIPDNAVTPFSFVFPIGSTDATNGLQFDIMLPSMSALTTKNFLFMDMDARIGSISPTSKGIVPIAIELVRCQRFFQLIANASTQMKISAYTDNNFDNRSNYALPVRMRVAPTVTITAGASTNATVAAELITSDKITWKLARSSAGLQEALWYAKASAEL